MQRWEGGRLVVGAMGRSITCWLSGCGPPGGCSQLGRQLVQSAALEGSARCATAGCYPGWILNRRPAACMGDCLSPLG